MEKKPSSSSLAKSADSVALDESGLAKLAEEIRKDSKLVSDRSYNFKKYPQVVVGNELVAWLVYYKKASSPEDAIVLGQKLVEADLLHHVVDEHKFKNEKLYYRFRADESDYDPSSSTTAAALGKNASKKGILQRRTVISWVDKYCVLRNDQKKLYIFDSDINPLPSKIIDLSGGKLDVTECGECKKGSYCFNISDNKEIYTFCANKSVEQEQWIAALIEGGASFIEDEAVSSMKAKSLFEFKALDIDKKEVDFKQFEGKVCLVVNVACFWGLTPVMYEQMVDLYKRHRDKGFEILAFPCNQFGKQEPGTNEEIKQFVSEKFGVSFPLFDKINVNGKDAHPIFIFLRSQLTGLLGSSVKWNFTKFLCNKKGIPIKRYGPPVKPLSFEEDILKALAE